MSTSSRSGSNEWLPSRDTPVLRLKALLGVAMLFVVLPAVFVWEGIHSHEWEMPAFFIGLIYLPLFFYLGARAVWRRWA